MQYISHKGLYVMNVFPGVVFNFLSAEQVGLIIGRLTNYITHSTFVKLNNRPQTGGYFRVFDMSGNHIFSWGVGEIRQRSPVERAIYENTAAEKSDRLIRMGNSHSHITSAQSKVEKILYAGAVRVTDTLIFSFSGLNEEMDEALVLLIATDLGFITPEKALEISGLWKNEGKLKLLLEIRPVEQ